jgi:uncharacterized protein YneF (UPF0154 family)
MKLFLIIVGIVVFLAVVTFGVVGYFRSKKLFAEFTEKALAKLPLTKANIIELNIENLNAGTKYTITFADNGADTTYVAYEDKIRILHDLKNNEKPFVKYKHLKNDVPFPKVKGWAVERGFYDIELHIVK